MGLLKAVHGAVGSVLEEQWKEFFVCDALRDDTLLVRAHKHIGKYSANTRKDDDVLTNGSVLSVADGQCVLVVKQWTFARSRENTSSRTRNSGASRAFSRRSADGWPSAEAIFSRWSTGSII